VNYHTPQEKWWATIGGEGYGGGRPRSPGEIDEIYINLCGVRPSLALPALIGPVGGNILEVGCNRGDQMNALREAGHENLWGIDIASEAILDAHRHRPRLRIQWGSAYDIPDFGVRFDVVYTFGLLIHQPPDRVEEVMLEIVRVAKPGGSVCGVEYWSKEFVERTPARTWSGPFAEMYERMGLKLQSHKVYPMPSHLDGAVSFFCMSVGDGA